MLHSKWEQEAREAFKETQQTFMQKKKKSKREKSPSFCRKLRPIKTLALTPHTRHNLCSTRCILTSTRSLQSVCGTSVAAAGEPPGKTHQDQIPLSCSKPPGRARNQLWHLASWGFLCLPSSSQHVKLGATLRPNWFPPLQPKVFPPPFHPI